MSTTLLVPDMRLTKRGKLIAFAVVFGTTAVVGANLQMPAAGMSLPACVQEDGSGTGAGTANGGGCSWDGGVDGNGVGLSYYVVPDHGQACYIYPSAVRETECVPLSDLS